MASLGHNELNDFIWHFLQWCINTNSDSMVYGANMGPTWGRQDPGGPHVGPMNLAIWEYISYLIIMIYMITCHLLCTMTKKMNYYQVDC